MSCSEHHDQQLLLALTEFDITNQISRVSTFIKASGARLQYIYR